MAETRTQTTPSNNPARMIPPFSNPPGTKSPAIRLGLDTRKESPVLDQLEQTLADTYAVYLKTQYAHWNVSGPLFKPLHDLFEAQYQELFGALDEIAERIRTLGRPVQATFSAFSERTHVEEWDAPPRADEMMRQLMADHESVIEVLREVTEAAEGNNDQATLDLAATRLAVHEKHAWMLRVHLE